MLERKRTHVSDINSFSAREMPKGYNSKGIDKLVTPRSDFDGNYRRRYAFLYPDKSAVTMGFATGSKDDFALFLHRYKYGNADKTGMVTKDDMPRRMLQDKWLLGKFQKVARQDNGRMFGHTVNRFLNLYNHTGQFVYDKQRGIRPDNSFLIKNLDKMTNGYNPDDHMEVYFGIASLAMTSEYYYNSQYKKMDLEHQYHTKFTPEQEVDLFNSKQRYHYNFKGKRGLTRPKYAIPVANKRLKLIGFYQTVIEGQSPSVASKLSYGPRTMKNFMRSHPQSFRLGSRRRTAWISELHRKNNLKAVYPGSWAEQLRHLGDICHHRIVTGQWKQDINRPNCISATLHARYEQEHGINQNQQSYFGQQYQQPRPQHEQMSKQSIQQFVNQKTNNFGSIHKTNINWNQRPQTQRQFHAPNNPQYNPSIRKNIEGMGMNPDVSPAMMHKIQQHKQQGWQR